MADVCEADNGGCHRAAGNDPPDLTAGGAHIVTGQFGNICHLGDSLGGPILFAGSVDNTVSADQILCQNIGVTCAHREIHCADDLIAGGIFHRCRHAGGSRIGADAQATEVVVTEGIDLTAFSEDEGDIVGRKDLYSAVRLPIFIFNLANFFQAGPAQLTVGVLAPAPNSTVLLQSQDMVLAHSDSRSGDRLHTADDSHFHITDNHTVNQNVHPVFTHLHTGQDPLTGIVLVYGKDGGVSALHGPASIAAE